MATTTLPGKLCPYSVYEHQCDTHDCDNCDIAKEARLKAEERADWPPARVHLRNVLGVHRC